MNAIDFLNQNAGYHDRVCTGRDYGDEVKYPVLIPRWLETDTILGQANHDSFLEQFGDNPFVDTIQKYGYSMIMLKPNALKDQRILETLASLEDYPCLDEMAYSQLEQDAYSEAWNDYGHQEFCTCLIRAFNKARDAYYSMIEYFLDELDDPIYQDESRKLYEHLRPSGEYFVEYSDKNISLFTDRAADQCSTELFVKWIRRQRAIARFTLNPPTLTHSCIGMDKYLATIAKTGDYETTYRVYPQNDQTIDGLSYQPVQALDGSTWMLSTYDMDTVLSLKKELGDRDLYDA